MKTTTLLTATTLAAVLSSCVDDIYLDYQLEDDLNVFAFVTPGDTAHYVLFSKGDSDPVDDYKQYAYRGYSLPVDSVVLSDDLGRRDTFSILCKGRCARLIKKDVRVGGTYTLDIYYDGDKYSATQTINPLPKVTDVKLSYSLHAKEGGSIPTPAVTMALPETSDDLYIILTRSSIYPTTIGYDYGISCFKTNRLKDGDTITAAMGAPFGRGNMSNEYFQGVEMGKNNETHALFSLYSISKDNYKFMKAVEAQTANDGGAYSATPASLPSNFHGKKKLNGQFFAVSEKFYNIIVK